MRQQEHDVDTDGEAGAGSSPRLYQRVYDILADEIDKGSLVSEIPLTEAAIAARFGVSRAPARRALAELQNAGLIERSQARGFVLAAGQGPASGTASLRTAAWQGVQKLVSLPTWERIYGEVEGEIIARISFATWRLNEAELARHYRVSRTVARDVIGRLQQSGLVHKDDRSRWYAPALTAEHVGELYELRWLLEPVALGKAAPNLPAGLLTGMRAELEEALANPSHISGAILDRFERDLHIKLLGHCDNRALMQALTYPQSLLIAHRFLYRWTSLLFDQEPFLPEHLDIVRNLEAGKVGQAAHLLESHLRISRDRALARVGVISAGSRPEPLSYLEPLTPIQCVTD